MIRMKFPAVLLTALSVGLAVVSLSLAAKPGGGGSGGGGGSVPPGTIYFEQWQSGFETISRSMKVDGSGKAASIDGEPSYQLHEGTRWFLTSRDVTTDQAFPEYEVIAVADDGEVVSLGITVSNYFGGRWGKDDSFLSYEAILAGIEGESAGLFVVNVDWSLGIPVLSTPIKVMDIELVDGYPTIYFGDWSPTGDEYVYVREEYADSGDILYSLEIARFFADGTIETRGLVTDSFAYAPQWSPDGASIAFQGSGGIWTIKPDGTGAVKLTSPSWPTVHYEPSWSPDSAHLVFTERVRKQKGSQPATYVYDVLRISAAGGATTNLTGDVGDNCYAIAWR
jgi:hypothetical protein